MQMVIESIFCGELKISLKTQDEGKYKKLILSSSEDMVFTSEQIADFPQ